MKKGIVDAICFNIPHPKVNFSDKRKWNPSLTALIRISTLHYPVKIKAQSHYLQDNTKSFKQLVR